MVPVFSIVIVNGIWVNINQESSISKIADLLAILAQLS